MSTPLFLMRKVNSVCSTRGNRLIKSEASKKLEEYAKAIDRTYPDFVKSMGIFPQKKGIDEELWLFVEKSKPDYDQLMEKYLELADLLD